MNRGLGIILFIILGTKSPGARSEIKHYYECPLKVICQTMIDHYRLDPAKSLVFKEYRNQKVAYIETKKDRRLSGIFSTLANYSASKNNNVITLYDGIGLEGGETQSNFQFGTFLFNFQYNIERLEDKLAPIENLMMGEKINIRKKIFEDLLSIFPRYSITGSASSNRGLFDYLYNLDSIKVNNIFLDTLKKDYKKMIGLYKRKTITIEKLSEMNEMVTNSSQELFDAQSRMNSMFPSELRLKKKLDLLKGIVEKNEDLIIAENINESAEKTKICSMLEFIERDEGITLGALKLEFETLEERLTYTFPQGVNISMSGSLDDPSSINSAVSFGVSYRLFDRTENYIARILYRENKKDTAQSFSDQKEKEFERLQVEAQSFYQVREFYQNMQFNYEQRKIFNKGFYRGNIFKNTLKVRNEGFIEKNNLFRDHMISELGFKQAKAIFLSNIFRVKAICSIVDDTVKDLD